MGERTFEKLVLTGPPYEDCTVLSKRNPLPSDGKVIFQSEGHLYFFTHELDLPEEEKELLAPIKSVTGIVHRPFRPFNEPEMARKKAARSDQYPPDSDYYQLNYDQILELWEMDRRLGTEMHDSAERKLNGLPYQDKTKEMWMLENFLRDHPHLEIYRTESYVHDVARRICGSADALFFNHLTGRYLLVDFKRCREIRTQGYCECRRCYRDGKWVCGPVFGKPCTRYGPTPASQDVEDCNLEHYRLQLTLYRYYFELNDNLDIEGQALLVLNPTQENYFFMPVEFNAELLLEVLDEREQEVKDYYEAAVKARNLRKTV